MKTSAVLIIMAALAATPALAETTTAKPQDSKPAVLVPQTATTTSYDPKTGFPDHVGGFSGMMVVIPQKELEEFNKPSSAGRHLDRVAKAEPGAVLAVKLVFVGMKPDYYNQANVTYDLQVIAPDGRTYGDSDYHGIDALHGQLGDETGVFDNRNKVVLLQFEPQDMPGAYTIKAVLHDNNGKVDLPLQTSVELIRPNPDAPAPVPATMPDTSPVAKYTIIAPPEMQSADEPDQPAKATAKHHRRHRRR